jgi:hypothetical protein
MFWTSELIFITLLGDVILVLAFTFVIITYCTLPGVYGAKLTESSIVIADYSKKIKC